MVNRQGLSMENKEIELVDYLRIIWKKKWLILFGTLLFLIIAIVMSYMMKQVYEIDSIIQPGKFFIQNQSGHFEQVVVEEPLQIADKVKHRSYNVKIAAELNMSVSNIPDIRAENIKDTLLTRMWIRNSDVELSKKVLNSLVTLIKSEIDEKIDIEIADLDSTIRSNEIEKERRMKEIEILKKKIGIIGLRKKDISDEMKAARNRREGLEKEQLKVLKNEDKSEAVSLGLLLYSNEILQSYRNYDIFNEKLSKQKLEEEDVNSALQRENANIANIDNTIENLKEQKGRIDHTKVIKAPESSLAPILPKKMLNIVIAIISGLLIFLTLAFFLNYLEEKKFKFAGK